MEGVFYIGELPDGRFVAASNHSPVFCFRADSEDAVLDKVKRHLGTWSRVKGQGGAIKIKSFSRTLTTLQPTRRLEVAQAFEAA